MLRKLLFVVSIAAFTFAACGRQVTPDRTTTPSGLPSGFMQVKFTTTQPMDFTNVQYVIVFNTSGSGGMPYANGFLNNYANYSFAIIVNGAGSFSRAQMVQYVRSPSVGGGSLATPQPIVAAPQQLQYSTNSDNTQFTVTVDRRLFNGIVPVSPSPGVNPNIWYANWFTTNTSGQPIDAPGISGVQNTSFTFPVSGTPGFDVTTNFDSQWTFQIGWPQVSPASAQIAGGEIINNGASPSP